MTYVLAYLRIKKTDKQTEGNRNDGACKFQAKEKVRQFVQNNRVEKKNLRLQRSRNWISYKDDQQQENGVKPKLIGDFT